METYMVYPENKEQSAALKAVFKALGVSFKKKKKEKEADDFFTPEMYKQIEEAREEYFSGGGYGVLKTKEDITKFLEL